VGRKQGIPVEKLQALPDWAASPLYDELERLTLGYAEAMTRTPADVPDELFAGLRAQFSDAQLVELTASIAWENYRARFNRAFLVESDGLAEGAVCLIPAAKSA
jgi:alkylhydroperoxidase family enzyme